MAVQFQENKNHVMLFFFVPRFFMPHGLTIDHEGNTWLTDVALHQVCVSFYLLVFVGESEVLKVAY